MITTRAKSPSITWFLLPLGLTVGLWSKNADARCELNETDGANWCEPNTMGDTWHSYIAVLGSDAWGQWIVWYDVTTNECDPNLDMVGDALFGLDRDVVMVGLNGNDYLSTVHSVGTDFCGFHLDAPLGNGFEIRFHAGLPSYDAGNDQLIDYTTFGGWMTGSAEGTNLESWGPSLWMRGGAGNDLIVKYGSPSAAGPQIETRNGDNIVQIRSTIAHNGVCGTGWDTWCGPSVNNPAAVGCEVFDATCP